MTRRPVLLVGGDSLVVAALRDYFRVCHGDDYKVESVEYCDDALATLSRPVDLVLLLSLRAPWRTWPSLSSPARHIGAESAMLFLKQMRALHNPVPVVLVSGWASAAMEAEAFANGAFAVLPKPFVFAELDSLMALALAARRQTPRGEMTREGKTR
jgi:DNA-binding NtrC family response regulator